MTMTTQQAADVLRKFSKWFPSVAEGDKEVHAAIETAIAVMEATPPTDEQIGEIFERYADRYVYDNPYTIRGYWHYTAMTRTAAIKFAKEILVSLKTQI